MAKKQKKKKKAKPEAAPIKDFLDMIAPAAVKFNTDSSVLGSSCRCTLALRSYAQSRRARREPPPPVVIRTDGGQE